MSDGGGLVPESILRVSDCDFEWISDDEIRRYRVLR